MNRILSITAIGCKQFSSPRLQQSTLGIVEFYNQKSNLAFLLYLCESCLLVGLTGEVDKEDMMDEHILRKYINTPPEMFSSCCLRGSQ